MAIKEGKFGRSKLTSVWLNIDDYNFCKSNNISFAQIFRDAIREMKFRVLNGQAEPSKRIESLKETITKMSLFLDKSGLLETYAREGQDVNNQADVQKQ